MKLWTVKLANETNTIMAYSVTTVMLNRHVVWADGVRIEFSQTVMYVEKL
jgi:hypothetical protein